jgi:phosphoglycolate phosphatase
VSFPRIEGTAVEIVESPPRAPLRHAVLDLDGTISLLRDGWQDHMVPMMVEVLLDCPGSEAREEVEKVVIDFVDHLTGKQTIYQMIRLAEEVRKRGGTPEEPLAYKREYYDRLNRAMEERLEGLRRGELQAGEFLLAGAREFLEELERRGVACYLASGTDVEYVRSEAALLGIERYFGGGIFGALPQYREFSKERVIRKILADHGLSGPELLVVGDGYVEIENGRAAGAVAFGIYSRENNRYHMNADKRARLQRAGAHLLAPDLVHGPAVLEYLQSPE